MAYFNRVWVATATVGTGTVTTGSAVNSSVLSFANANNGSAIANGTTVTYELEEGNDFEIGRGVYSSGTLTRATVLISKIGGSIGTTKMTLAGAATCRIVAAAQDFVTTYDDDNFAGLVTVTNATAASAVGTGAFRVTGGASVAGSLYVGTNVVVTGVISAIAKQQILGAAGGNAATGALVPADANVILYNGGGGNWAGYGADNNGFFWVRVGYSGTGPAAHYIDASTLINYFVNNIVLAPPSSATPANNGQLTFQATSNTSLTFKFKGSDGTVRSASLTLA